MQILELHGYATLVEIKHSDWLLQVMWQVLTNQSALFQRRVATLTFLYDIGSRPQNGRQSRRIHFAVCRPQFVLI